MAISLTNVLAESGVTTISSGADWTYSSGASSGGTAGVGGTLITVGLYAPTGSTNASAVAIAGFTQLGLVQADAIGTDRSDVALFFKAGYTDSSYTITGTGATGVAPKISVVVDQVTGINTSGVPVQTQTGIGASSTSLSGTFGSAPATNNATYVAYGVEVASATFTPGTGYSMVGSAVQGYSTCATEVDPTGSQNISMSWSSSGRCAFIAVELPAQSLGGAGSAAGTTSWHGSASGSVPRSGHANGSVLWHGLAHGLAAYRGASSGAVSWHGSASGQMPGTTHSGLASGGLSWAGGASGTTAHSGAVSGAVAWAGQARGSIPPTAGLAVGIVRWVGVATGKTPFQFSPPFVVEWATDEPGLFRRMQMQRGVTVLKNGTSYRSVRQPSEEDVASADIAYLGGHVYTITAEEAAALIAAGYEVQQ